MKVSPVCTFWVIGKRICDIRLTGQVPPSMILSKLSASGMRLEAYDQLDCCSGDSWLTSGRATPTGC